jgi:hypothetical protein
MPASPARADAHERWAEAHLALDQLKQAHSDLDHNDMKAARKDLHDAKDHLKLEEADNHRDLAMKQVDVAIDAAEHDRPKITIDNIDKAIAEIQLAWK